MKIVTSNIEQFLSFFDVVYDVGNDTIEFKFYIDRMTCAVLDGGKTRFFYIEYDMKFFDEYDVDEVESVFVSLEDMYKLVKLANKTDTLTLSFKEAIMTAELESVTGNKRLFEFVMPDDYISSPPLPELDLPSHIEVATSDLKQSVKDIRLVGTDIFQFILSEDTITLMSDTMSDIHSTTSVKYAQVIEGETGVTDVLAVRFTLDFIEQMLKFDKISKTIMIDIGELALMYKYEDDLMGVNVYGMIAPRIEMEDEE